MTCVAVTLGLSFLICEMKGLKRKLSESVQHYHVYIWKTASPLHSLLTYTCLVKGVGWCFFTRCQELGDTQPAAERVCSGNCVTRWYDQILGCWQRWRGTSGYWKESLCVSRYYPLLPMNELILCNY